MPDVTYVATSGAPTFLNRAAEFHQAWGLQPKRVDSLQAVPSPSGGRILFPPDPEYWTPRRCKGSRPVLYTFPE